MVPCLQPVFVFLTVEERLPRGKARRGPALRLLAGKGGLVLPSQLILQHLLSTHTARGSRLTLGRRSTDWMLSFMVSHLPLVFV